jgi:hypothetical protein
MSFPFQEDIKRQFTRKNDIATYLGCQERYLSCLMIRSSFCVVLCGELVNVCLRNISNSTEPREKRYTGALCALRPHIFVLTPDVCMQRASIRSCNGFHISSLPCSLIKIESCKHTPILSKSQKSHHDCSSSSINNTTRGTRAKQHVGNQIPDASGVSSNKQSCQSHSRKCQPSAMLLGGK